MDESETCHCIVFTVVRESEPCHEKSEPGQEKSETFLNCAIHATAGVICVVGDSFDLSYSNPVEYNGQRGSTILPLGVGSM